MNAEPMDAEPKGEGPSVKRAFHRHPYELVPAPEELRQWLVAADGPDREVRRRLSARRSPAD